MKNQKNTLSKGILHNSQIFTYRTKDGRAYFQFSYHYLSSGHYEMDIHQQPSYQSRSTNINTIHRLNSPRVAPHKICITSGKEPKSLDKAKKVSCDWAELTWNYIKNGTTLDTQIAMRNN